MVIRGAAVNSPPHTAAPLCLRHAAGVIPRAIHQIFSHLDSINSEYTVKCSFLELYNEETTDLLAVGDSKAGQKLRMLEDKSGVVVQGGVLEANLAWPCNKISTAGRRRLWTAAQCYPSFSVGWGEQQ